MSEILPNARVIVPSNHNMDEIKITIINAVQKYPCLWDPREKDYRDVDQKSQVWDKITKDLNIPSGKFFFFSKFANSNEWYQTRLQCMSLNRDDIH